MDEETEYLTCLGCGWGGSFDELVSETDAPDDNKFIHCPQCMGTDFETDEDE